MTDKSLKKSRNIAVIQKTARRIAFVSALFSLIVLVMMFISFTRRNVIEPQKENKLAELKNEFKDSGENPQLEEKIRQLDLEIRQDRMRWLDFSRAGAIILLFGAGITFAAFKYASNLDETAPSVNASPPSGKTVRRQAVMSQRAVVITVAVLAVSAVLLAVRPSVEYISEDTYEQFHEKWPCFRGPDGSGTTDYSDIPLEFNVETNKNILWKTPVPMEGKNSPVVWDDRLFLSGGNADKKQVFCFDANTGDLIWKRDVEYMAPKNADFAEPMEDTGYAAPTLAVDGKRVYAIFATGDIAAFDFSGQKVWAKNLGVPDSIYGYASSLVVYKKLLVVQYDQGISDDGLSKMIALDGFSGKIVWQTKRPVSNSWASPVIVNIDGQDELIANAEPFVISYDPATGEELWRVRCMSGDIASSPIYAGGNIFAVEPYNAMTAIKKGGRGNITETHISWKAEDEIPDICSPVSNGKYVFMLTTEGVLTCLQVLDGKVVWQEDLEEMFQASPSIVDGKLVLLSEKGNVTVAEIGPEYKQISKSLLKEHCVASPAFAPGRMYIRSEKNLYCIGKKN